MTCGIYLVSINDKIYIGKSHNIEIRIGQHRSLLKNNKHYNVKMQEAYNLNKDFTYKILEVANSESLDELEYYYIDQYNSIKNGLNISSGGTSGSGINHPSSVYTKEQIEEVFFLLLDIDNNVKTISKLTKVSESTIRHVSRGEVHYWLKELYPVEFDILQKYSISRLRNSAQRSLNKYKFTKLKAPDGNIYEVDTSIVSFAKKHNLDSNKVGQVMLGKRNKHKDWVGYNG